MAKIAFSLLVHEKPLVILDQVINILSFNPNSIIVLHFNPRFNENDELPLDSLLSTLKKDNRVYINPHPVQVSIDNIIQGHLSNYNFVKKEKFDYFYLIASNELFVCSGAEAFVQKYDYGCFHNKNKNWVYFDKMSSDESLRKIIGKDPKDGYYLSQVEGSFYSKEIFGAMVETIENNFGYKNQTQVYPREEMYFSSITGNFYNEQKRYDGCLCFINWKRGLFVSIKDIKRTIKSENAFSVKRVERQSNNYLREYIRRLVKIPNNEPVLIEWGMLVPKNHLSSFQIRFIDLFWRIAYLGRSFLVFLKRVFTRKK